MQKVVACWGPSSVVSFLRHSRPQLEAPLVLPRMQCGLMQVQIAMEMTPLQRLLPEPQPQLYLQQTQQLTRFGQRQQMAASGCFSQWLAAMTCPLRPQPQPGDPAMLNPHFHQQQQRVPCD